MPTIQEVKDAVRARDGHSCTRCGMTREEHRTRYGRQLEVHRVIPGSPYTVEGCVTLCRACHGPQPRRSRAQPDLASSTPQYAVHVEQTILGAVDAFRAAQRFPASRADIFRLALREFLEREGYWPADKD